MGYPRDRPALPLVPILLVPVRVQVGGLRRDRPGLGDVQTGRRRLRHPRRGGSWDLALFVTGVARAIAGACRWFAVGHERISPSPISWPISAPPTPRRRRSWSLRWNELLGTVDALARRLIRQQELYLRGQGQVLSAEDRAVTGTGHRDHRLTVTTSVNDCGAASQRAAAERAAW